MKDVTFKRRTTYTTHRQMNENDILKSIADNLSERKSIAIPVICTHPKSRYASIL